MIKKFVVGKKYTCNKRVRPSYFCSGGDMDEALSGIVLTVVEAEKALSEGCTGECVKFAGFSTDWYWRYEDFDEYIESPVIYDPNDPRVAALIGKTVEGSDNLTNWRQCRLHETASLDESSYPFRASFTGYRFIRAVAESEVQEVTMEEVCAKFGKNVKIKK